MTAHSMTNTPPPNQNFNIDGDVNAPNGIVNVGGTITQYINTTVYINWEENAFQPQRTGATSATLYTSSRVVDGLPDDDAFFGYEDERDTIQQALEQNARVHGKLGGAS